MLRNGHIRGAVQTSGLWGSRGERESKTLGLCRIIGQENSSEILGPHERRNHQPWITRASRRGEDRVDFRHIGRER